MKMRVDPDNRQELVQTFNSLYRPILLEPGCLGCRFYCDMVDDNVVMIVEEWESERLWNEHLQSKEFTVLIGAMSLFDPNAGKFQLMSETEGAAQLKKLRTRGDLKLVSMPDHELDG